MPAGHEESVSAQLLAPAVLKVLAGQLKHGAMPPTPKLPARQGRDRKKVVGAPPQYPFQPHSELSITNVTAPFVDIVEGAICVPDRAPQPEDAHGELALGPLNTNRAKQPPPTMAALRG